MVRDAQLRLLRQVALFTALEPDLTVHTRRIEQQPEVVDTAIDPASNGTRHIDLSILFVDVRTERRQRRGIKVPTPNCPRLRRTAVTPRHLRFSPTRQQPEHRDGLTGPLRIFVQPQSGAEHRARRRDRIQIELDQRPALRPDIRLHLQIRLSAVILQRLVLNHVRILNRRQTHRLGQGVARIYLVCDAQLWLLRQVALFTALEPDLTVHTRRIEQQPEVVDTAIDPASNGTRHIDLSILFVDVRTERRQRRGIKVPTPNCPRLRRTAVTPRHLRFSPTRQQPEHRDGLTGPLRIFVQPQSGAEHRARRRDRIQIELDQRPALRPDIRLHLQIRLSAVILQRLVLNHVRILNRRQTHRLGGCIERQRRSGQRKRARQRQAHHHEREDRCSITIDVWIHRRSAPERSSEFRRSVWSSACSHPPGRESPAHSLS